MIIHSIHSALREKTIAQGREENILRLLHRRAGISRNLETRKRTRNRADTNGAMSLGGGSREAEEREREREREWLLSLLYNFLRFGCDERLPLFGRRFR